MKKGGAFLSMNLKNALIPFIIMCFMLVVSVPQTQAKMITQQVMKDGQLQTIVIDADKDINYNIINDEELKEHEKEKISKVTNEVDKDETRKSSKIHIRRAVKAGKWSANSAQDIKSNMDAQGISVHALAPSTSYEIQYGDTLVGISKIVSVKINQLIKINRIVDPDKIYAGDNLLLN